MIKWWKNHFLGVLGCKQKSLSAGSNDNERKDVRCSTQQTENRRQSAVKAIDVQPRTVLTWILTVINKVTHNLAILKYKRWHDRWSYIQHDRPSDGDLHR
jgi:hypothetical protein